MQVALKTLQVWEAIVQNAGDTVKPFVNNLLPFVVSWRTPSIDSCLEIRGMASKYSNCPD